MAKENNQLSDIPQQGLVPLLQQQGGLNTLLTPLVKEIFLFETYVAGTSFLKDQKVLDNVQAEEKLVLQREDNRFDEKAVLVLTADGQKLGYIPRKDNVIFSRLMDAGKILSARVRSRQKKGGLTEIRIGIYLVDF